MEEGDVETQKGLSDGHRMSGLFWRRSWRRGGKAPYGMRPKPLV